MKMPRHCEQTPATGMRLQAGICRRLLERALARSQRCGVEAGHSVWATGTGARPGKQEESNPDGSQSCLVFCALFFGQPSFTSHVSDTFHPEETFVSSAYVSRNLPGSGFGSGSSTSREIGRRILRRSSSRTEGFVRRCRVGPARRAATQIYCIPGQQSHFTALLNTCDPQFQDLCAGRPL